ncbi:MAG TPA: hypothetical protein VNS32_08655 [Flavisolibacter sp.]|nr:hypothetical protein [Flavisolibacter sp.]
MKYSSSVSFLVALLLFFLPFVEIKCNATSLYKAKGIELVTGFTVKDDRDKNAEDNLSVGDNRNEKQEPNGFAIAAFVLGILGLVLSVVNFRSRPLINTVIGTVAALCLLALLVQVQSDTGNWSTTGKTGREGDLLHDMARSIRITAQFTAWYYLSVIAFIAAAFFSYRRKPIVISR